MSEAGDAVREVLGNQHLQNLPDNAVSFSTLRTIYKVFASLPMEDQRLLSDFIQDSLPGPQDGSFAMRYREEGPRMYEILEKKVPQDILSEAQVHLSKGGFEYRFPLAVVNSVLQNTHPQTEWQDITIRTSQKAELHYMCEDAEAKLATEFNMGGASIITYDGKPLMVAKLMGKQHGAGKDVALCLKSVGPFVAGVLYSPAAINDEQRTRIIQQMEHGDAEFDISKITNDWIVTRPIWGVPEEAYDGGYHPGLPKRIFTSEAAQKFTNHFAKGIESYVPYTKRPSKAQFEVDL